MSGLSVAVGNRKYLRLKHLRLFWYAPKEFSCCEGPEKKVASPTFISNKHIFDFFHILYFLAFSHSSIAFLRSVLLE